MELFTAKDARQLQLETDLKKRESIIRSTRWDDPNVDGDLINILYDVFLVAQTQCTRSVRALAVSDENLKELGKLGYHFDYNDFSKSFTISF